MKLAAKVNKIELKRRLLEDLVSARIGTLSIETQAVELELDAKGARARKRV